MEEREVDVESLSPFFEDYELVLVFRKLQELPSLVCATTSEGDFVVFHESLWRVLLERGIKKVKALFFKGVWDMMEIFYLREEIFRRKKKALAEFYYTAYKNFYGEDFYRKRAEVIKTISQKAGISPQVVYEYLRAHLRKEKGELRKKAEELYTEGKTQMQIAKMLGVPRRTISDWLKKGGRQEGSPKGGEA
jgi:hypothetical protein